MVQRVAALDLGIARPTTAPLGDVMCGSQVVTVDTPDAVTRALDTYDPRTHVILEASSRLRTLDSEKSKVRTCGSVSAIGPNERIIDVTMAEPAAIILRQAYASGWTWTIADQVVPTFRAYGSMTGTVLPQGNYRITARYQPPGLELGATLTCIGLLVAGFWYARERRASLS